MQVSRCSVCRNNNKERTCFPGWKLGTDAISQCFQDSAALLTVARSRTAPWRGSSADVHVRSVRPSLPFVLPGEQRELGISRTTSIHEHVRNLCLLALYLYIYTRIIVRREYGVLLYFQPTSQVSVKGSHRLGTLNSKKWSSELAATGRHTFSQTSASAAFTRHKAAFGCFSGGHPLRVVLNDPF